MTPNVFGPGGTGDFDYNSDYMPGTSWNGGYGMNAGMGTGFQGNFQPGFGSGMGNQGNFGPGMGNQGGFQPGYGPGTGFQGNFQPGTGFGMGFQNNFQPAMGMPFPGNFGPGMGFQGGFQPGFGPSYPGTFLPNFNMNPGMMNPGMNPGMGPGFTANFQPGFGPGTCPVFEEDEMTTETVNPTQYMPGPMQMGWGLGGGRRWGGAYSPQFVMTGLPTDEEVVELVYDAIDNDPLIPFDADINVDSDAGTVTLTGTVMTKQIKHAAGDDAWWIPGVDDVSNQLTVERRHPAHAANEPGTETRQPTRGTKETTPGTHNQQSESTQTPRATRRGVTRR